MTGLDYLTKRLKGIQKSIAKIEALTPDLRGAWAVGQLRYFKGEEASLMNAIEELQRGKTVTKRRAARAVGVGD